MGQFGCPKVKYLDQELSIIMEPKPDEFYTKDNAENEHVYILHQYYLVDENLA